jgi:hypothetical protein
MINAYNQMYDALTDGIGSAEEGNNLGALFGVSSPSSSVQDYVSKGLAAVTAPVLYGLNYLSGEKPYVRKHKVKHSKIDKTQGYPGEGPKLQQMGIAGSGTNLHPHLFPQPRTDQPPESNPNRSRFPNYPDYSRIPTGNVELPRPKQSKKSPPAITSGGGINNLNMMSGKKNNTFNPKKNKGKKKKKNAKKKAQKQVNKLRQENANLRSRGFAPSYGARRALVKAEKGAFKAPIVRGPVAATTMNQGNRTFFRSRSSGSGLGIHSRIFLGTLKMLTTGATSFICSPTYATDTKGQWYFIITNFVYMGDNSVCNLAQYFDQWKIKFAKLVFSSAVNPNSTIYKVTWCACDSVDHWEKLGITNATTTPTKAQILGMGNSWEFPAWKPESTINLPISSMNGKKLATAAWSGISSATSFSSSGGTDRTSIGGTAGIRVDGTSPAADLDIGDIFLEFDIELIGMSPKMSTGVSIMTREEKMYKEFENQMTKKFELMLKEDRKEEREEKKEERKKMISDTEFDRLSDVDLDDHKIIVKRSSSNKSIRSDTIKHSRKFDSTLGYPGEGPGLYNSYIDSFAKGLKVIHNKDFSLYRLSKILYNSTLGFPGEGPFWINKGKLHGWARDAMLADLNYHAERKYYLAEFKKLLDLGGDYKLHTNYVSTITTGLSNKNSQRNDSAVLALNTCILNIYDETDDSDEDEASELPAKSSSKEKEKSKPTDSEE